MALNLMGSIKGKFEEKKLGGKIDDSITFRTGLDLTDAYCGGRNIETNVKVPGLPFSKMIMIIGKSGTGKTTKAVQMAWAAVEPFENGSVIHVDFERSTKVSRIQRLLGIDQETMDAKYLHLNDGSLCSEAVYEQVKNVAKLKLENREALEVDYECPEEGKTVRILPPTVFIIDSIPTMIPRNINEEEELSGSMSASAIAKANGAIIKRLPSELISANITIIFINHITTKISINPMVRPTADVNFLKPDESLPGGTANVYLCDTLLKLVTGKKLDPDKEFGIQGFYVEVIPVKSRSAAAGRPYTLVYDQNEGFSNVYSCFNHLKECKKVLGGGTGYYLEGLPDVKFSQKAFTEKLESNEALQQRFAELMEEEFERIIV